MLPDSAKERGQISHTLPGWERLKEVMCEACGMLHPPLSQTDRMLRRLSELARFGLAAGGNPILKR
jgi:hypothetical protein